MERVKGYGSMSATIRAGLVVTSVVVGAQTAAHATARPLTMGDYTGDHKTDFTIYRPSNGTWYSINSATNGYFGTQWGVTGDIPVSGDFSDGAPDGITDPMVFRPSDGRWYWIDSTTGYSWWQGWGMQGDLPAVGDYDGDGVSDIAIWRHYANSGYAAGMWWIINSHDWSVTGVQWGQEGDIPVPCDYDGDGKSDIAVFRPSEGNWYITFSSTGGTASYTWGTVSGDIPVPGDYDGDGKCDLGAWNPAGSLWSVTGSIPGGYYWRNITIGTPGDVPSPGDYDGDGITDAVVWRPTDGTWYGVRSSDGGSFSQQWGSGGPNNGGIDSDVPLANLPGAVHMIGDVLVGQEQYDWCWAATAQMVAAYSAVSISQCEEANVATSRTDCCTNPSSASDPNLCNVAGWWDQLPNYGFTYDNTDWGSALSFTQLQGELNANRPVPFGWGWTGGGGHNMVAIKTWVTSAGTQWVTYNNPDPVGSGEQDDILYADWVSSSDHVHWQDSYNVILN